MADEDGLFAEMLQGLEGFDFVKKIRDLVADKANWKRDSGLKMIWNMVTADQNNPVSNNAGYDDDGFVSDISEC